MTYPTKREVSRRRHDHLKQRAAERYGIELNCRDRQKMICDIQEGSARFLFRQSQTRSFFVVDLRGVPVVVVYHRTKKEILTVMPKEAADRLIGANA